MSSTSSCHYLHLALPARLLNLSEPFGRVGVPDMQTNPSPPLGEAESYGPSSDLMALGQRQGLWQ